MDAKQKTVTGVGVGAIAIAIALLSRGEKIDCSPAAKQARMDDYSQRFDDCLRHNDRACDRKLAEESDRTIQACVEQEAAAKKTNK